MVLVIEGPDYTVQYGGPQPHVPKEHLKCGLSPSRCAVGVTDFKELVQKKYRRTLEILQVWFQTIAIKQVTQILWFPSGYKSYV